jgi:hypothetical protein
MRDGLARLLLDARVDDTPEQYDEPPAGMVIRGG